MILASLGVFLDVDRIAIYASRQKFGSKPFSAGEVFHLGHDPFKTDEGAQEVSGYIRQFCDKYSLKPQYLSFGIGRSNYFWNLVEMPPVGRLDLFKLFQYEIEMHVPAPADDIVYDVLPLDAQNSSSSKVTLVSTSKQVVSRLVDIASRTNLQGHAIEQSITAIQRLINRRLKAKESGIYGILLQSGRSLELGIGRHDAILSVRSVQLEADDETDLTRWVEEFRLALLSLDAQGSLQNCSQLFLAGDFSLDWKDRLRELWPGLTIEDLRDSMNDPISHDAGPLLCAQGLSFAQSMDQSQLLNLLPHDQRPVHRHTGLVLTGVFTGILMASTFIAMANSFWSTQFESYRISNQIGTLESRVQEVLDINKEFGSIRKDFETLRSISRDYPSQLEVLREITRVMPAEDTEAFKKVWLESYSRNDSLITLVGQSESPEGLITILEDSDFFEKVRFDGNVAGQKFTIKATLSHVNREDSRSADDGDTGKEESDSETKSAVQNGDSPEKSGPAMSGNGKGKDRPKPTVKDEAGQDSQPRGPAFPRDTMAAPPSEQNPSPDAEPAAEGAVPKAADEKSPEDIEKMKNNLFDFIKKHKDEGNVVERERNPVEPDSEEAAANFLEFLKSAANEQNSEQRDGNEGN